MKQLIMILALAILPALQVASATPAAETQLDQHALQRITKEVHHELVLLPYYGVFDSIAYQVAPDGTVTLLGQVANPVNKPDAERAVKGIEGVTRVVNNIEVLPPSPLDDRIRRATYVAIYRNESLSLYATRNIAPIHIIVKNGHVTLIGYVSTQMDKQIAEMQARSVPDVFSVDDQIQVEK